MSRVTIRQVASEADVCVGTASLVLNGKHREKRISEACVNRVCSVAVKLGYHGSYHARTLLRGKSMTLGLIANFYEDDSSRPGIETGFITEAGELGYEVLNITMPNGKDALRKAARYVCEGRIDGFAVYMSGWEADFDKFGISEEIPMLHIWFYPNGFLPLVTNDAAPGIRDAVRHLAELGHKKIAWIGTKTGKQINVPERLAAFTKACSEYGINTIEHYVQLGPKKQHKFSSTVSAFHEKLSDKLDFLRASTAAFCYNDDMAVALGLSLREKGLRIPRDLSLVGFDDTQAHYAAPPLSTVSHMFTQMGRTAAVDLDEMIKRGAKRHDKEIKIPSEFIIRESTGRAPAEIKNEQYALNKYIEEEKL